MQGDRASCSHEVQQSGSATVSFWPTTRQPTLARCVKVPYMVVARAAALQHRKLTGRLTALCGSCAEQIRPKGTMECQEPQRHDLLEEGRCWLEHMAICRLLPSEREGNDERWGLALRLGGEGVWAASEATCTPETEVPQSTLPSSNKTQCCRQA